MFPDLDALALFVRACELSSLTKAAEERSMSLAAASRRIGTLQERAGQRLLDRTPRGVVATQVGRLLAAKARTLLDAANAFDDSVTGQLLGRVRLLATTSAMTHFLPTDLARFNKACPGVNISVGEAWSDEIARQVEATTADVGIVVEGTLRAAVLERWPYRSYHIAVVHPEGHPLERVSAPRYADVLEHDVIALESASLMMRSLFDNALALGKELIPRVQVRSFEAVCRFVHAGLGVGLLPYEAAVGLASEMGLEIRLLAEPWAERRMLLCFREERAANPSVMALLQALRAQAR